MSGLRRLLGALAVLPALALAAPAQGSLTPVSGPHPAGPSLAGTVSGVVTVSEKRIAVTVSYTGEEDEAWASSVMDGLESGLPALVKATGYPYPGPGSADNFAAGLFGQSVEHSRAAQGMVEGAGHAALIRVLVALALLGTAAVAGLVWLAREEPLVSDEPGR